jgi:hypothetical protein
MGTMQRYASSKDIYRDFCKVCGATVFSNDKERPDLVSVSVGLLDPEEGARVEKWLVWCTERVGFNEMAISKGLVESLKEGLKRWTVKRGNEKNDESMLEVATST